MAIFAQSSYRFTDPIRYFKANDPIYYEVDNIPLKQLQQNDLWLKDQLVAASRDIQSTVSRIPTVGRSTFTELQPYIDGTDNVVYVRRGRYTARINDVFNLQPMQLLNVIPTSEDIVTSKTNNHAYIQQIIDKVKGVVAADSLALNGLVERIFTKASAWHHTISPLMLSGEAGYNEARLEQLNFGRGNWPYPMYKGRLYIRNGIYNPSYDASTVGSLKFDFLIGQSASGNELGYASLALLENEFIKKWRGVARTSIVDIPEELSIEIPPFDPEDYFYFDSGGQKILIQEANQRIDLLFVYSKPIDTSAATIAKFTNGGNTPTKIYTPQLGIVKGAGLGLNKRSTTDPLISQLNHGATTPLQDENGNNLILASHADTLNQNLGFSGVKGSFPSPDDLLNFAPTLADNLENNHMALLGQSILPLAYVVVRAGASQNENDIPRLTPDDLIDIRPFFRTTELAYNERAGIAAAHPQISLANPVATQSYVDLPVKDLYAKIAEVDARIPTLPTISIPPRVISAGYIYGGLFYGVESVLLSYLSTLFPNDTVSQLSQKVKEQFDYPTDNLPNQPGWDKSSWFIQQILPLGNAAPSSPDRYDWLNIVQNSSYPADGGYYGGRYSWLEGLLKFYPNMLDNSNNLSYPTDLTRARLAVRAIQQSFHNAPAMPFQRKVAKQDGVNWGNSNNFGGFPGTGHLGRGATEATAPDDYAFCYVKKKIIIHPQETGWASDYMLKASYHNCTTVGGGVGPNNIIVTKEKNLFNGDIEFTIIAGWPIKIKDINFNIPGIGGGRYYNPFPDNKYIFPLFHRKRPPGYIGPGSLFRNWNGTLVITNAMSNDTVMPGHSSTSRIDNTSDLYGMTNYGVALYPTVKFEIIGIPSEYITNIRSHTSNTVLTI